MQIIFFISIPAHASRNVYLLSLYESQEQPASPYDILLGLIWIQDKAELSQLTL